MYVLQCHESYGRDLVLQDEISFYRKRSRFTGRDLVLQEAVSFYRKRSRFTATGWTVRGSNPGSGGEIFRTRPDLPWGPTQPPVQWVPGLSRL
jgi:hypothetical protein